MKINTKKLNTKRNLIITLCAVVVTLTAYFAYAYITNSWPLNKDADEVTSLRQSDAETDSVQTPDQTTTTPTINKTPVQNEPTENKPEPGTLQASITVANQNDNVLQIRTLIEDVTTTGTCTLTLTSEGKDAIVQTTGIHALANSSTCKGFDIPTDKLTAAAWKASIVISVGDKQVELLKNITVN